MRIALLDPICFTRYVHDLARSLAELGHDVKVFTGYPIYDELPTPQGYERDIAFLAVSGRIVKRMPRSRWRFVFKTLDYVPETLILRRRLAAFAPDVVHVQTFPVPSWDRRWARRIRARYPVVYTAHEVWSAVERPAVWRRLLANVDRVLYHHRSVDDALDESGVLSQPRDELALPMYRQDFGDATPSGTARGRTLLFFGRIQHSKGLDVLIRAMPEIARRVPGARLRVVGLPMDGDGAQLVRLARAVGADACVDWDLRRFHEQELPAMMDAARVVVLPYRQVAASAALSMTIAHERPCVVTEVGDLADKAREHGFGLIVPPEDEHALASACVELLEDDELWGRLHAASRRAAAALSWSQSARAHAQIYDDCIAQRAAEFTR